MPYIKQEEREELDILAKNFVEYLEENYCTVESSLNYLINKIVKNYIDAYGENYVNYNAIIGSIECAKFEIMRRKLSRYEDRKIVENGDIK